MKNPIRIHSAICFLSVFLLLPCGIHGKTNSVSLDTLTWVEAEQAFKNYEVVLLALGASTKEHGPHLPLKTDYLMAEYFKERVAEEMPVVVLPTLQYGHYPAFLEYPGSISLEAETFEHVVIDICRSMNGYGLRKFYILNTGISTLRPLQATAEEETSMMLYIAPESVDMSKAVKDFDPRPGRKGLTRNPEGQGSYSPTGIWGDPTLATREKGQIIVDIIAKEIVKQVHDLIDFKLDEEE